VDELDRPETLAVDRLGLIGGTARAAQDLDAARAAALAVEIPYPPEAVRDVAICGMGGSAIAADLVAGAYAERLRRPVAVVRGYGLPGWAGEDTLVVLSSYSGNTEETLTCGMDALDRGALVVAVTSGGKLRDFYGEQGVPVIPAPPGFQPRAAMMHLLVPLVVTLGRLGVIPDPAADLDATRAACVAAAEAYGPDAPQAENPAKQLAAALRGTVPLVYGAESTAAVAYRWKCQLNENAKVPAFSAALPELDHNEIVGYEGMGRLGEQVAVVMLREARQHRQVERRFELTRELIEPGLRATYSVMGEGEGQLARVLDLALLGDFTSLYLACLLGVDPGPVDIIERLKDRLAGTGYGRAAAPQGG
jgi:glucose/mannose-6-phosphate isomerase